MAEINISNGQGLTQGLKAYVEKLKAEGKIEDGTDKIDKKEWTNTIHQLAKINESRSKDNASIFSGSKAEDVDPKGFKGGDKDYWQKNMVVQGGKVEFSEEEMKSLLSSMGVKFKGETVEPDKVSVNEPIKPGEASKDLKPRELKAEAIKDKKDIKPSVEEIMKSSEEIATNMSSALVKTGDGVSSKAFKEGLSNINKDNVVSVLESYKEKSGGETLAGGILSEWGSSKEQRREAVTQIAEKLFEKAEELDFNEGQIVMYRGDIQKQMNAEFKKFGFVNSTGLDDILQRFIDEINKKEAKK